MLQRFPQLLHRLQQQLRVLRRTPWELLAPLTAPLYVVPGNRDDNRVLRTVLKGTAGLPENTDIL